MFDLVRNLLGTESQALELVFCCDFEFLSFPPLLLLFFSPSLLQLLVDNSSCVIYITGIRDTSVNRIYRNSYFHGAYSLVRRQIINHKNNRYLHSMLEGGKYLGKNEVRKRDWGRQ